MPNNQKTENFKLAKTFEYYMKKQVKRRSITLSAVGDLMDLFDALVDRGLGVMPIGELSTSGTHKDFVNVAIIYLPDNDSNSIYIKNAQVVELFDHGKKISYHKIIKLNTLFNKSGEKSIECIFNINTSCVNCADIFNNFIRTGEFPHSNVDTILSEVD